MSLFDHIKKVKNDSDENKPAETVTAIDESLNSAPADQQGNENVVGETPQYSNTFPGTSFSSSNEAPSSSAGKRYSVGIDLGTTHCVLSYADITDIESAEFSQQVMAIPQLFNPGLVENSFQLPSLPEKNKISSNTETKGFKDMVDNNAYFLKSNKNSYNNTDCRISPAYYKKT